MTGARVDISTSVEPIQPRWLKLIDAVRYSGLGKMRLKELAMTGEIIGGQDSGDRRGGSEGTWIFDRLSIDRYRLRQLSPCGLQDLTEELSQDVLS
jgi:hypothetical protein